MVLQQHLPILLATIKIWCVIYSVLLLSYDVFFTLFPTSVLGISLTFGLLYYFRLDPVSPTMVNKVLGEDTLRTDTSLTFQTTSRLMSQQMPGAVTVAGGSFPSKRKGGSNTDMINGQIPVTEKTEQIDNPYSMQIVAHRGAGFDAPENTLVAFRNCKTRGCTAVEFDVGITKDGIPVLFHDDDLRRMTGADKRLTDVTYDELKTLELVHPLTRKFFVDERVPTFLEGITTCLQLDLRFFIDIKDSQAIPHILLAYKSNPQMYNRAIVTSFNLKIIYDLRKADPNIMGCCAWRPGTWRYKSWDGSLQNLEKRSHLFIEDWTRVVLDSFHYWLISNIAWWFVGLSVVLLHKDGLRRDDLSRWTQRGVRVFSWSVNNPVEKLHTIQNYRIGYLTDSLDMPRIGNSASGTEFFTPIVTSQDKLNLNGGSTTALKNADVD